jgi:hypothetical protein
LKDTKPNIKSPQLLMTAGTDIKSSTTSTTAPSTYVTNSKTPTLAEMLDEIQQSKRRLLSQPSPLLSLAGRSHLVCATAPIDVIDTSNAETQSAAAALSSTYNAIIGHLGTRPASPCFPTDVARLRRKFQIQQQGQAGEATTEASISVLQTDDSFDSASYSHRRNQRQQHPT